MTPSPYIIRLSAFGAEVEVGIQIKSKNKIRIHLPKNACTGKKMFIDLKLEPWEVTAQDGYQYLPLVIDDGEQQNVYEVGKRQKK